MASGQGSHWLIKSPTMFIYVQPALLRYVSTLFFKHIHASSSYTIRRQFVPLIYCPLRERVLPDIQSTLIIY